jgi:hypothetical protein
VRLLDWIDLDAVACKIFIPEPIAQKQLTKASISIFPQYLCGFFLENYDFCLLAEMNLCTAEEILPLITTADYILQSSYS